MSITDINLKTYFPTRVVDNLPELTVGWITFKVLRLHTQLKVRELTVGWITFKVLRLHTQLKVRELTVG